MAPKGLPQEDVPRGLPLGVHVALDYFGDLLLVSGYRHLPRLRFARSHARRELASKFGWHLRACRRACRRARGLGPRAGG